MEFLKKWVGLEGRKDKLISQGYNPSWKLDLNKHHIDKDSVITNRDITKYLMLPEVSQKLEYEV